MPQKIKNITLYLLTLSILLASVGMPLHIRICAMPDMGMEKRIFVQPKSCCDHSETEKTHCEAEETPLNPCCSFDKDYLKLDFNFKNYTNEIPDFAKAFYLIETIDFQFFIIDILSTQLASFYTDTSPPKSGRQILLSKNCLLV